MSIIQPLKAENSSGAALQAPHYFTPQRTYKRLILERTFAQEDIGAAPWQIYENTTLKFSFIVGTLTYGVPVAIIKAQLFNILGGNKDHSEINLGIRDKKTIVAQINLSWWPDTTVYIAAGDRLVLHLLVGPDEG